MQIRDSHVDLDTPHGLMRTFLYEPHENGRSGRKWPGLILYSEIFQQTGPIRRLAERFAGHGFVVAVPEIYHTHLPPGTVLGYDDAGKAKGNELKTAVKREVFDADVKVLIAALGKQAACTGKIGAVGFCIGGPLAFRAALNPEIRATACVCATDLHTGGLGEGRNADTLDRCGEIKGELLMLWGRQDPHIPLEGRRKIHQALEAKNVWFTWHEFNADHAYMRDEGERFDPEASRLSLDLALDLFRRNLG